MKTSKILIMVTCVFALLTSCGGGEEATEDETGQDSLNVDIESSDKEDLIIEGIEEINNCSIDAADQMNYVLIEGLDTNVSGDVPVKIGYYLEEGYDYSHSSVHQECSASSEYKNVLVIDVVVEEGSATESKLKFVTINIPKNRFTDMEFVTARRIVGSTETARSVYPMDQSINNWNGSSLNLRSNTYDYTTCTGITSSSIISFVDMPDVNLTPVQTYAKIAFIVPDASELRYDAISANQDSSRVRLDFSYNGSDAQASEIKVFEITIPAEVYNAVQQFDVVLSLNGGIKKKKTLTAQTNGIPLDTECE